MNEATPDHYEVLGVARGATPDELKAAYRRASSAAHPDRDGGSDERMAAVNRAYDVLSDPVRRQQYDDTGSDEAHSIAADANAFLAGLFQTVLTNPDETIDPVKWVLHQVHGKIAEAGSEVKAARRYIEALTRRRSTVRRKTDGASNLVHALIDRKIQAIEKSIPANERVAEVARAALAQLADYEYVGPEAPGFAASRSDFVDAALLRLGGKRGDRPDAFSFFTGG